jgi:hypothetical protein
MTRLHGKNPRLIALASVTLIIGAALILWGTLSLRTPSSSPFIIHHSPFTIISTSSFAQPQKYPCPIPGEFKEVDIPVGLLCDYYEHGIEHAPPRDPSGVMQKRERFYAAPQDPFELLKSARFTDPADAAFSSALGAFRSHWETGETADEKELKSLEESAGRSSLKSNSLIEAGRAMNWLCSDEAAAVLFRSALAKATNEYARAPAGDPAALPLLHAIGQTKALWRLKAWPVLEQRFRLANMLYPRLSYEQRRAHYLVADMLYSECRCTAAAAEITEVVKENDGIHDLGLLDPSDIPEMQWTQALFLMADGQLGAAIPLFDACATHDGLHQLDSKRLAVLAEIRSDRLDEARRRIKGLPLPAPRDALTNSIRIELAARTERQSRRPM